MLKTALTTTTETKGAKVTEEEPEPVVATPVVAPVAPVVAPVAPVVAPVAAAVVPVVLGVRMH